MRWNVSDYGGVRDLRIPPHRLWKPDVLMYNSSSRCYSLKRSLILAFSSIAARTFPRMGTYEVHLLRIM
ncbi:Acetylcholine receptor subunit beta-like 1 [Harpegnathos saltator]|uniref:Acetylcholine receptor subunit beta-like 1 n=1 Tax=Harpegnathos saltator TaxID=610380 RepID=E2BYQ7_HARSA|nr:Acetylcholine receptor subunit beta-like 1 [Harpegnathos saltator]